MNMFAQSNAAYFPPPLPSTADRATALSSRGHFCGQMVIGDGTGRGGVTGIAPRIVQLESYLEYSWCLCFSVRTDVADIHEQVAFGWLDEHREYHTHYFDLVLTMTDGRRIGCAVRPAARASERFMREMSQVASQARASRFVDDVRLLTDEAIVQTELYNAKILHSTRMPQPKADALAMETVAKMTRAETLQSLTERMGIDSDGFRALLRRLRHGDLSLYGNFQIGLNTSVCRGSALG